MKTKTLYVLIILLTIYSCKLKTHVILATDDYNSYSDDRLIKNKIASKTEKYTLDKKLYKNRERKKLLQTIEDMCNDVLTKYQSGTIGKATYNRFAKEAHYTIQHAIYMMENEKDFPDDGDDYVLQYLQQGIKTLNNLLKQ